jgi:hypothetical protein
MTRKPTKTGIVRIKDMPPGPPGLAGYCWVQEPGHGFHCCEPVGHEKNYPEHANPYHKRRWT